MALFEVCEEDIHDAVGAVAFAGEEDVDGAAKSEGEADEIGGGPGMDAVLAGDDEFPGDEVWFTAGIGLRSGWHRCYKVKQL